ncbi:MAG: hypothetical protein Q9171_002921 [Xanthocarpia ochracea]
MSMEQKLQVLNALFTLKNASPQSLDSYKPLVEALVIDLQYPYSRIHKLVTCILWDLGQTENLLSFYDCTPKDRIDSADHKFDQGFIEYLLALDINRWWQAQFDTSLAAVIVLRAPHTKDIRTLITAFTEEIEDKLSSIPQVEDKICCGLKLLVCEQISDLATMSILMGYHQQLESVPFKGLYDLVKLMQASPSILNSAEKDTARFKDLHAKHKNGELLITSSRVQ